MADQLFPQWFNKERSEEKNVTILTERKGGRETVLHDFLNIVADHLIDLSVIQKMGGFEKSAHVLRNRLPQTKKIRSGDLGEIIASEFVDRTSLYNVPLKRLRYKDDREMSMRGDDVLGFRELEERTRVIKVESKSRARLTPSVIQEARSGLAKHDGRPNPGTLCFLEYLLRKEDRNDEADLIKNLQTETIRERDILHLIFTLSGNNPSTQLNGAVAPVVTGIALKLCGCHVQQHGDFIREVFESCSKLGDRDGIH